MPEKLERCVEHVQKTIKPRRKGQNKKSAAYGVCVASTGMKPTHSERKRRHNPSERTLANKPIWEW